MGESEVREAYLARANHLARIGEKDSAITALDVAETKTVALGQKLDIAFTCVRLAFFHGDAALAQRSIEHSIALLEKVCVESGGQFSLHVTESTLTRSLSHSPGSGLGSQE